ncbi:MAG: hypothetical protein ACREPZ_03945 [Rhodanobacteraceae bacterium]
MGLTFHNSRCERHLVATRFNSGFVSLPWHNSFERCAAFPGFNSGVERSLISLGIRRGVSILGGQT